MGIGKVNRSNGRARNRDSLDLDEIMNGFNDIGRQQDLGLLPKTATTSTKSDTRDLISFLESGPPEEFQPSRSVGGQNGVSSETARKGGGRFRSMVSRLRPRASTDFNKVDETGLRPPLRTKGSSPDVTLSSSVSYPRPPRISPTSPSSYNDPFTKETRDNSSSRPSSVRKPVPSIESTRPSDSQANSASIHHTLQIPADAGVSPTTVEPIPPVPPSQKPVRPGRSAARDTLANGHSPIENGSAKHESKRVANGQHVAERSGVSKQFAEQLVKVIGKAETVEECRLVVQALLRQAGHSYTIQAEHTTPTAPNEPESWPLIEMLLDS